MARREAKPARREESARPGRKPGGLFLGILLGLVIGLIGAAGLAWYFNLHTGEFKPVEQVPDISAPVRPDAWPPAQPRAEASVEPAAKPAEEAAPPPRAPLASPPAAIPPPEKPRAAAPAAAPIQERKPAAPGAAPPSRVPLTFYGILPGEKPAKPVEPPKPKELWWLQVAALKNPADADRLKARLSLLGLEVVTQEIDSAGQSLYRVRVGPYKRDEDAFADLDTLAANNFEPRLFKEPVAP